MTKIIGIIQARLSSTRLPEKVMLELSGKPILWHIYYRLKQCSTLSEVVISTGEHENNKTICDFASTNNIPLFVGSEIDLIDRLYKTALEYDADAIVRITGDCPLVDPKIVDTFVRKFLEKNQQFDIITNLEKRTFPHGLDVEVISTKTLKKLWNEIKEPELREWFPFFIQKNPNMFKILNIKNNDDYSKLRWTLDYLEDYEFLKQIYTNLFHTRQIFHMQDILDLLKKYPKLKEINSNYIDHHNIGAPKI